MITIDQVKQLREETSVSVSECKKALESANGDFVKAKEILRKLGKAVADKKSSRETKKGIIETYIHPNKKTGVILELNCETDFVAKNEDFINLAHEICLQIAAMNPLYIKEEDVPQEILDKEKEICQEQFKNAGKPEKIIANMVEGKLKKYKEEKSLLSQPWVKDDAKTVKGLIEDCVSKLGENISVKRFTRYDI